MGIPTGFDEASSVASASRPQSLKQKTIYFIRNAESKNELIDQLESEEISIDLVAGYRRNRVPDPSLTSRGVFQALRVKDSISVDQNLQLIVTSPLRRALQTTTTAFSREIEWKSVPVKVLPELSEVPILNDPERNRLNRAVSPLNELVNDFPQIKDSLIEALETSQPDTVVSGIREGLDALRISSSRVVTVRHWLLRRPESVIAVITHDEILKNMLFESCRQRPFMCGEIRQFVFKYTDQTLSRQHVRLVGEMITISTNSETNTII